MHYVTMLKFGIGSCDECNLVSTLYLVSNISMNPQVRSLLLVELFYAVVCLNLIPRLSA